MSLQEKKDEIAKLLGEVNDVAVLNIIEGELSYFLHRKSTDVTDILTAEEIEELRVMVSEPPEKDTITLDQFREEMKQWRTKS